MLSTSSRTSVCSRSQEAFIRSFMGVTSSSVSTLKPMALSDSRMCSSEHATPTTSSVLLYLYSPS